MAKNTLKEYLATIGTKLDLKQEYKIVMHIGTGFTYSKYNNFFHYINVIDNYWSNPDINYV